MDNFIYKADYKVAEFFHEVYLSLGEFSNGLMKIISYIGEAGILFLLTGLVLALFKRTRKIGVTIIVSVAIGFLITNVLLKNIVCRTRPFESMGSDFYKWWLDAGATSESGYSFPSGHTTATTAFSLVIFLTVNKKYSWPILFLPVLMASSRIYLMVHYFTDCLGGIVAGCLGAIIAYFITQWMYTTKLKLFVWMKNFELFKSQNSNNKSDQQEDVTYTEMADKEFTYVTQEDEKQNQIASQVNLDNDDKTNIK